MYIYIYTEIYYINDNEINNVTIITLHSYHDTIKNSVQLLSKTL